jgi:hypothetical protein
VQQLQTPVKMCGTRLRARFFKTKLCSGTASR